MGRGTGEKDNSRITTKSFENLRISKSASYLQKPVPSLEPTYVCLQKAMLKRKEGGSSVSSRIVLDLAGDPNANDDMKF